MKYVIENKTHGTPGGVLYGPFDSVQDAVDAAVNLGVNFCIRPVKAMPRGEFSHEVIPA